MILVRSPLRITLGGGGTDLPAYAKDFGGFCLTAAITQYVYVSVLKPFAPGIYLKYSQLEKVEAVEEVSHALIREALASLEIPPQVEITTLADIPAGTGLGGSSSFATALLQALTLFKTQWLLSRDQLAEAAATLEMARLREPIGKQDAYAAAYGGLVALTIAPDGCVRADPLVLPEDVFHRLEDRLLLFYTGHTRPARTTLQHQHAATVAGEADMLRRLHHVKLGGALMHEAIKRGELKHVGPLFHEHWEEKRTRTPGMTNDQIDGWYDLARKHGAIGGKLVGAGAGGCLLFYTEDPEQLRTGLQGSGLQEIRFRFDLAGTRVLLTDS